MAAKAMAVRRAERGGDRRSWERLWAIWPDAAAGPITRTGTRLHLPAFGEIAQTYEKNVRGARVCWGERCLQRSFLERFDHRQDYDADHQGSRYLIDDPIKSLRMLVPVSGKVTHPARQKAVDTG